MNLRPIRLSPGQDMRAALEATLATLNAEAAFVLAGIGSLSRAQVRYAGATHAHSLTGDLEVLSLGGSIATNGSHLHIALSTASGAVVGGHVAPGCIVRTTAEILLVALPDWSFVRADDAATGYAELMIRPRAGPTKP